MTDAWKHPHKKFDDNSGSGGESGGSIWNKIFRRPGKSTPSDRKSEETLRGNARVSTPTADTIAALRIAQGLSASYASNPAAVQAALNTPTAMQLANGTSLGLGPTPHGGSLESEDGGMEERQREIERLFGKRAKKDDQNS